MIKKLVELIKKSVKPAEMPERNAALGNYDGIVKTGVPYQVYARLGNGTVVKVQNYIAPNLFDLKVRIGRVKGKNFDEVISFRDSFSEPTVPNIPDHNDEHRYLYIYRDQIIPLLVLPIAGTLTVQVMGSIVVINNSTWAYVANQVIDLSASLPTAGARYVLFQYSSAGVVTTVNGTVVDGKENLSLSNVPAPTTGNVPFCAVRMYDGQIEFSYDNDFARPFTVSGGGSGGVGATYLDELLDVQIDYPTEGQVLVYDAYSEMWVNQDPTGGAVDSVNGATGDVILDGWTPYSAVIPTRIASALDGTFTVTIASPAVATKTGHGLITGSRVYFTTTGALPTGLAANTDYWVMRIDANTFNICTSFTNAIAAGNGAAGVKINTSGTQSGVHTLHHVEDPVYRLQFAGVDLTTVLQEGMPFKLTQNSIVRHGWISSTPAYSGGNTTFCGLTRCDSSSANYDILDTGTYPISDFYYGLPKQPGKGFPLFEDYWKISLRDTTNATQGSPATNIYNLANLAVMLPVARWNKDFYVLAESVINLAATQLRSINAGLSNNIVTFSEIDVKDLSFLTVPASATATIRTGISRDKIESITTETVEYLLCQAGGATAPTSISFRGDVIDSIIECVCDYL